MPNEKEIKLMSVDGESPNSLGVDHINVQERGNGVYLQNVDDRGRKLPLKHKELLSAYGHVLVPDIIKSTIKEIESLPEGDAHRQELEQEVAEWQKDYTDNWQSRNKAYNPESDEYEGVDPDSLDEDGNSGQTVVRAGQGDGQPAQIVIKNFNRNSMDHNTVGVNGPVPGNGNQAPGATPNQAPTTNPNQAPDTAEVLALRTQLEEAQRRNEQLEREKEELQRRLDEQEQRLQELQNRIDALENPPPPPGPTPEDIQNAANTLTTARDELAKYDIRRSARITDRLFKRRKEDAKEYKDALKKYVDAQEALAQLIIARERALNTEDGEIRKKLTEMKYDESAKYAERLVEINDEYFDSIKGIRRPFAQLLRHYANVSTRNKILLGLLIGGGAAAASFTLGGGLAILVAGSAARSSLGLISHKASLRNVSKHSLKKQLEGIQEEREKALASLGGAADIDDHTKALLDQTREERQANTRGNVKRNRRGTALMLGGITLSALGIAGAENIHLLPDSSWLNLHWPKGWPSFHNPFKGHTPKPPGSWGSPHGQEVVPHLTADNFHPDSFTGVSGVDAVHHALLGSPGIHDGRSVFELNGIHVDPRSVTPDKIQAINADMIKHGFHIASGVGHGGNQNIVDWPGGQTVNANASALEGFQKVPTAHGLSSVQNWQKFLDIARRHGVRFSKEG